MIYYLDNIRDLVDEADERIKKRTPHIKRGPGRPPTDPADVAKVLLLQTYVSSSNRLAEGFLLLFQEKLGIGCHSAIPVVLINACKRGTVSFPFRKHLFTLQISHERWHNLKQLE